MNERQSENAADEAEPFFARRNHFLVVRAVVERVARNLHRVIVRFRILEPVVIRVEEVVRNKVEKLARRAGIVETFFAAKSYLKFLALKLLDRFVAQVVECVSRTG
jgi:hypothetical protein